MPRRIFVACLFFVTASSATPSFAAPLAVGELHICAVRTNNLLACWGSNMSGQLGNGQSGVPVTIDPWEVKLDPADKVLAVAAGGGHTCALLKGGTIKCWGDNYNGQLGLGEDLLAKMVTLPQTVVGLNGVTDIAAGIGHTCAVTNSGAVWCWGSNSHGQVGADPSLKNVPAPVQVSGVNNAKAIFAGGSHTCALTGDGKALCWGDNGNGQQLVPLSEPAVSLALGQYFSCALLQGGSVKCWGGNSHGELGNGGKDESATPVDVSNLDGVTAIAAGDAHACALRNNGTVWCWGNAPIYEKYPTIFDGLVANSRVPVEVKPPYYPDTYSLPVKAIAAGGYNVCLAVGSVADKYGILSCWGRGEEGQLAVEPASLFSKSKDGATVHYGKPGSVKPDAGVINIITPSAADCAADEDWNAVKQHCAPKLQAETGAGQVGPVAAVWEQWGPHILKLHADLSKAVLAVADISAVYQSKLDAVIEPEITKFAKQVSQMKSGSLWALSKTPWAQKIGKESPLTEFQQSKFQKMAELKPSEASVAAKDYNEASANMQIIFTELNNDLVAILETSSGTSGFDAKSFKTYRDAVAVYISSFFALAAKQELNVPGATCAGKPIEDRLLFKYLFYLDRKGKEEEARQALKALIDTLQCAPKEIAWLASKGLYSSFNMAMQIVKATQPAYVVPMRDYFLTALWPVITPLVDRIKERLSASHAMMLMEQYAKRWNSLGPAVTKDEFDISLQPKWFFMYSPDSQKMEELQSCPWPAPPFTTPLPATTEGLAPKTPLGVTNAQIVQEICPWKTPIWPVWDGGTPCISVRNFAQVVVNPVALGYLTCPYWYTARVGMGCDHVACEKKADFKRGARESSGRGGDRGGGP